MARRDELKEARRAMMSQEMRVIDAIVIRAAKLAAFYGKSHNLDRAALTMDLESAHMAHPLHLDLLLSARDSDFAHDVFGIHRHIDRETGEMKDCFMPRFAMKQTEIEAARIRAVEQERDGDMQCRIDDGKYDEEVH